MADVTADEAHWLPQGNANPLGATYAHLVLGEDGFVNGMLQGTAPLFATTWAGRTGASEVPPEGPAWDQWGRQVRIDLPVLREYAQVVYAASDQWLASLSVEDMNRTIDLSPAGLGQQSLGWVLGAGVVGHVQAHWGEICCLKGLQGGRGYPV